MDSDLNRLGDKMRAKIIADNHEYSGAEFRISFLSYDMAAGTLPETGGIVAAAIEELEFIYDADWEKKIINNREVLNIKKPREASYFMYSAVIQSIEGHLGEELGELVIIEDKDSSLKNTWMKNITILANGRPVNVNITGKKLSNSFSITAVDMKKDEFLEKCEREVGKLQNGLKKYTKRLNGLVYTIQLIKNDNITENKSKLSRIEGA